MHLAHALHANPDLIIIDAAHDAESATADIRTAHALFPHADLLGDDANWPGVQTALRAFPAQRYGKAWTIPAAPKR